MCDANADEMLRRVPTSGSIASAAKVHPMEAMSGSSCHDIDVWQHDDTDANSRKVLREGGGSSEGGEALLSTSGRR